MINFVPVLANILKKALKNNTEDPDVKTADPVVFEELKKKFEKVEPLETENRQDDILERMKRRVEEAKVENEVNPDVETAHGSVYENIMRELEKLKNQSSQAGGVPPVLSRDIPPVVPPARDHSGSQPGWAPPQQSSVMQAMTNSGGSLQIRQSPDMGAAIHQTVRIPDQRLITILEYSTNKINLDGKLSRFALIEYNGVRGWILESYLNFN